MRCINEQLTKANDCLRFAADDLRNALLTLTRCKHLCCCR